MAGTETQLEAVLLRQDEVFVMLRAACAEAGSQAAWASRQGFSPSLVSEVLHGRRSLTDRLLRALDLQQAEPLFVARRPAEVAS